MKSLEDLLCYSTVMMIVLVGRVQSGPEWIGMQSISKMIRHMYTHEPKFVPRVDISFS